MNEFKKAKLSSLRVQQPNKRRNGITERQIQLRYLFSFQMAQAEDKSCRTAIQHTFFLILTNIPCELTTMSLNDQGTVHATPSEHNDDDHKFQGMKQYKHMVCSLLHFKQHDNS